MVAWCILRYGNKVVIVVVVVVVFLYKLFALSILQLSCFIPGARDIKVCVLILFFLVFFFFCSMNNVR